MSEFILHQYAMSPFSEKIRKMLGYTGLEWQAVVIREMPPRPKLERLSGGYRKVPVAQIGADIFCDTHIIASEVAALADKPRLALENCSEEAREFATRVDLDIFFACLLNSGTKTMVRKVWQSMSARDIARFFADRIKLGRTATMRKFGPKEARHLLGQHLADLESRLQQDFIFGDEPEHADFSAYHSLWFVHFLAEAKHLDDFAAVDAWMDRMHAFGDGRSQEISADDALAIAADSTPRTIAAADQEHELIGKQVTIGPDDYAKDGTRGELVGHSDTRWILARDVDGIGCVHVHFPTAGYEIST